MIKKSNLPPIQKKMNYFYQNYFNRLTISPITDTTTSAFNSVALPAMRL